MPCRNSPFLQRTASTLRVMRRSSEYVIQVIRHSGNTSLKGVLLQKNLLGSATEIEIDAACEAKNAENSTLSVHLCVDKPVLNQMSVTPQELAGSAIDRFQFNPMNVGAVPGPDSRQ